MRGWRVPCPTLAAINVSLITDTRDSSKTPLAKEHASTHTSSSLLSISHSPLQGLLFIILVIVYVSILFSGESLVRLSQPFVPPLDDRSWMYAKVAALISSSLDLTASMTNHIIWWGATFSPNPNKSLERAKLFIDAHLQIAWSEI